MGTQIFDKEVWENWESSGKDIVFEKVKDFVDDNEDAGLTKPGQVQDLSLALYEIVKTVVKGELKRDYATQLLTEMMQFHADFASQLVEVLSMVELEISSGVPNSERDILIRLIKSLNLEKIYKERLDFDILGDAAIVKLKKNFVTKTVKVRTKMYYKQQKFNLLREESEGYAKLITELNQEISKEITPGSIIQVIKSLIGCFNLDPNRVLDLILEAFECRPEEYKFYISLLNLFPHEASAISEIIGFKLDSNAESLKGTKGVYVLIALLLKSNILSLSEVYDWLTPEDTSMVEDYNVEQKEARDYAARANIVSTKDKDMSDKDKAKEEEDLKERTEKVNAIKYEANQKIQLAVSLLEVGDWNGFIGLCSRFPDNYLISCAPVALALINTIKLMVAPFYRDIVEQRGVLPTRVLPTDVAHVSRLLPPPVKNFEELTEQIFPMLTTLGPQIYRDIGLMYTIIRLGKEAFKDLKKVKGEDGLKGSFYYEFLSVLDECILPAVSMFEANPCIAEEVWGVIKEYPYQHRYKLYGRWKNETFLNHHYLIRARTQLLKRAKYTMMRLTKETVKPSSRTIAKMTHNIPCAMFEYILKQVQLYDNLINPVVDSFKYLTSLSYDVLGYVIVEFLSTCKDRTGSDAMGISPWFTSLSSFCGSLCKKYNIDMGGILQFIANQLKNETSLDLLLLKDIIQRMGGADSMEDLKAEQIAALTGGEVLKKEAGQYVQEKNIKKSSQRLKDALMETELAIPLLLLMAQQRSSIIFNQRESQHLKLVGKLYDQCQDTMVQFGSYVSQIVSINELATMLPPIGELLSDFHINNDVAFFLTRPLLNNLLQNKFDEVRRKDKDKSVERKQEIFIDVCNSILAPVVDAIKPHYNAKVWDGMGPFFFLTFWTLSISDLEVPIESYDKELKKVHTLAAVKSNRKKDLERLQSLKEKLEEEKQFQLEHTARVINWLMKEKDNWFKQRTARSPKNDTVTTFLQLCIFPRCTFTTLDAMFCSKFVHMLHILKTPNFSTLLCYDRMYCDITYTVTSCTELEAHHYSRFLLGTLDTVMHWHSSQEHFENECAKYPGFITRYRISQEESNDYVDYENYRHVVHKWHYKITKALVISLESGDYIQIRNAIFVLQGIMPRFPAIINLAAVIEKRIEKVKMQEKNKRNDLYVLANSYSGRLKAKKPQLIPESCFHIVRRPEPTPAAAATAATPAVNGIANGVEEKEGGKGSSAKEASEAVNGDMDCGERSGKENNSSRDDGKRKIEEKDNGESAKKVKVVSEKDVKRRKEDKKAKSDSDDEISEVAVDKSDDGTRSSKRRKVEHESKSSKSSSRESPSHKRSSTRSRDKDKRCDGVRSSRS